MFMSNRTRSAVLNRSNGNNIAARRAHHSDQRRKRPASRDSHYRLAPWFLVNVIYQVENKKVVSIPLGKYGFLNAKDGAPLRPTSFLADAFPPGHDFDILDAEYFLTQAANADRRRRS